MNLKNKTVLYLGSSVTYGSASGGVSFVEIVSEALGAKYVKEAVSGTTLADIGEKSYVSRLKAIDRSLKIDLFVCQLSTNDASKDIAPEKTESAIRFIIDYIKKHFDCPIVFYTGTYYDSPKYEKLISLLYNLKAEYKFEILDLFGDEEMRSVSEDTYKAYMKDPIHPTLIGYKEWWSPRFIEFLRALPDTENNFDAERVKFLPYDAQFVDIYLAKIPEEVNLGHVYPSEREKEIQAVTNERVKREKYFVWKLLEYGLEKSLGFKINEINLSKNEHGKWVTDSCKISLSHSGCAVSVAISGAPIGVDIEILNTIRKEKFAEKILTDAEKKNFASVSENKKNTFLTKIWSMKEAIFKKSDAHFFEPSKIETIGEKIFFEELTVGTEKFILSVAADTPEKIRLFKNVDLTKI